MIRLSVEDLRSKWGFADGDLLDDLLDEGGVEFPKGGWLFDGVFDVHAYGFSHCVLIDLVEKLLLPALPRKVRTYRVSTLHNPIRLEDGEDVSGMEEAYVDLREEDVIAYAKSLLTPALPA